MDGEDGDGVVGCVSRTTWQLHALDVPHRDRSGWDATDLDCWSAQARKELVSADSGLC